MQSKLTEEWINEKVVDVNIFSAHVQNHLIIEIMVKDFVQKLVSLYVKS